MQKLVTIVGKFDPSDNVATLNIPNLSTEAALRVHRDPDPQVILVMVADPDIKSVHQRYFKLVDPAAILPTDFIKYIGNLPVNGKSMNIIEVTVLSTI